MNKQVYIYALCEPDQSWNVRYVGKTITPLGKRLSGHLNLNDLSERSHKNSWIKSLLCRGQRPLIKLLDIGDEYNWEQLEMFYIKSYRTAGFKLTNSTDGGRGNKGSQVTSSTRLKMSLIHRGRISHWKGKKLSEETKKKMSLARKGQSNTWSKGKALSEETRTKMSLVQKGKKHSEEHRHNLSLAKKGKGNGLQGRVVPQEVREKISKANKGKTGSWLGKKHTQETIEKMRITQGNRSEETKKKISKSKMGTTYRKKLPTLKIKCSKGHLYTSDTIYINPKGYQECKLCRKEGAVKRPARITVNPPLPQD